MLTWDQLLLPFWQGIKPFVLLMALFLLGAYVLFLLKRRRLGEAGMPEIDDMSGRDFESRMALLFEGKGFRVEQTPYVGDWGADLVLSRSGERTVVQAKRWSRRIGPRAIQEVVAAKAKYGCQHALVVTNSLFTEAAAELARANGVELWDRHGLARELLALRNREPAGEPVSVKTPVAAEASRDRPSRHAPKCFKCDREMVLKENARGRFWACSGFPNCRHTFPARS
jgi:restriction system protein